MLSKTPRFVGWRLASVNDKEASDNSSKRPIAFVSETYPDVPMVNRQISGLVRAGLQVIVLALRRFDPGSVSALREQQPVAVKCIDDNLFLSPRFWWAHVVLFWSSPSRYFRSALELARHTVGSRWMLSRAIYAFLKAGYFVRMMAQWDVGHVHAYYAGRTADVAWIISRLTSLPYSFIGISHDVEGNYPFLEQKLVDASFVVTASERIMKIARQKANCIDSRQFHVIHTGLDPERFCPTERVEVRVPIIISVTRLIPSKGLDDLIYACSLLRDRGVAFQCHIIGRGPQQSELERLIQSHELIGTVEMVGFLREPEVIAYLQNAQVFALPCRDVPAGAQDGLPTQFVPVIRDDIPIGLIEAMSVGLPVVSTYQSSIPELVDDQLNGLLVPSGQPEAVADALELLLSNDSLRSRLGREAREKILQDFDNLKCAHQLCALFEVAMSSQGLGYH
jgi:glycosyltransferase involved in cell wall biosynthesis|tara:strand:- start:159 stop:1511 length:1353 start_codon:yes stop_codon:yes gene_type:complete